MIHLHRLFYSSHKAASGGHQRHDGKAGVDLQKAEDLLAQVGCCGVCVGHGVSRMGQLWGRREGGSGPGKGLQYIDNGGTHKNLTPFWGLIHFPINELTHSSSLFLPVSETGVMLLIRHRCVFFFPFLAIWCLYCVLILYGTPP